MQIELRRFGGTLHANVVTVPIVEVDLGPLERGRNEVSIEVNELWFNDVTHPEDGEQNTSRTGFWFDVV